MRKGNIVVHGLREAGNEVEDGKLRKSHDLDLLQSLVEALQVNIEVATSLKSCRRLGEKSADTTTSSRPLLMSFNNVSEKESLLGKASKLKDLADWKSVSLVQDLTKKQRQQEHSLREKCDTMNADRSDDDAKNWIWKIVGRRGERRIAKRDVPQEEVEE